MDQSVQTKQCPFCAETIKAEAIVCRYCGRDLVEKPAQPAASTPVPAKKPKPVLPWVIVLIIFAIIMYYIGSKIEDSVSGNETSVTDYISISDNYLCSLNPAGYMVIVGNAKNINDYFDFRSVEVRGTVYDQFGDVINTNTSYIDSDILYKNSTSTFTIYVDDPQFRGSKCGVDVESAHIN